MGYESHYLDLVPDTAEALAASLRQGLSGDAVVILGASGQGVHDYAGRAIADVGANLIFRGVAMAPGRSTAVAQHQQTLIFGLPGSPWASFITFEMLVRPALDAMLGRPDARPVAAVLTADVSVRPGMTHFVPVQLQPGQPHPEAVPLRDLLAVARAESGALGMLISPLNRRRLPQGTRVRVAPL